jgi:SAM-dependent methyltransferase
MPRAWSNNPVARAAINRRLTGNERVDPVEYFQHRYCAFEPREQTLLLGHTDADFAVALVRSGIARRVVGIDESPERVAAEAARVPDDLRASIELTVEGSASYPPGRTYDLIVSRDVLRGVADIAAWCRAIAGLLSDGGLLWVDEYVGLVSSHIADRVLRDVAGAVPAPAANGPAPIAALLEDNLGVVHEGNYGGTLFDRYDGDDDAQLRTLMEVDFLLTDLGALEPAYLWSVYEKPSAGSPPAPVAPAERAELPMPPAKLIFMDEDEDGFRRNGEEIVVDLEDLCHLRPDSVVLDVGSGYGRVAHALWRHGYQGRYLGLELLPRHVTWCAETLTPASGGVFQFTHLDIANARYNPGGRVRAEDVTLPAGDASVEIGVLTSVFTHMYPREVERYLGELARVLRPAGRVYVTFFVIDERWAETALGGGLGGITMEHVLQPGVRYYNADDPLHAIGYEPAWIRRAVAAAGLRIQAMRPGLWAGAEAAGPNIQDIVVLTR